MRFITAAAALLVSAGMAQAACNTATLAGSWSLLLDDDTICPITIQSTGDYAGRCTEYENGAVKRTLNLSGRATLDSTCKVVGTLIFQGQPAQQVRGRSDAGVKMIVGLSLRVGGFTAMRN